jgi:hypothetical protein
MFKTRRGHCDTPTACSSQAVCWRRGLAKQGDWAGGSYWETVQAINQTHIDDIAAGGGDPCIGRWVTSLLVSEGFTQVEAKPDYSPALSSVEAVGIFSASAARTRFHITHWKPRSALRGSASRDWRRHFMDAGRIVNCGHQRLRRLGSEAAMSD